MYFIELSIYKKELENLFGIKGNITHNVERSTYINIILYITDKIKEMSPEQVIALDSNKDSFIHHFLNVKEYFGHIFQRELYELKKIYLIKCNKPISEFKQVYYKDISNTQ